MKDYSSVQFSRDLLKEIRIYCATYGLKIGPYSEQLWLKEISSSLSGSLQTL